MRIHLSLPTADLQAAERFYTTLFGTPPDKVRDDYRRFAPADVPIVLSLFPGDAAGRGAVDHMGLRIDDPDAVRAATSRLAEAGLAPASDDGVCCHADQVKIWVHDPDGRAWEVYAIVDDQPDRPRDPASTCCA